MVRVIADPANQPCRFRPIDQADRAVMALEKVTGDITHRRTAGIGVALDRQEELVLGRCQADGGGLLLAPPEKSPHPGAEFEQQLVVGCTGHGASISCEEHIVLR